MELPRESEGPRNEAENARPKEEKACPDVKQAEGALRESEELMRLFILHAPVALAMFDKNMRYLSFSRRWLTDYGLEGKEIFGRSHYEVFPAIPEHWRAIHQRALAGEATNAEEVFTRRDGTVQWVRWMIHPWRRSDGGIGGIVIFTEDISERKRAQETLHRYELLSNNSRDIILLINFTDGRILEANTAAFQAYGYSPEEMLGLTIQDLRAPDERAAAFAQMKIAFEKGMRFETVHRRKDGSLFPVEVNSQGAYIEGAQTLISVVRDITERKNREEALREKMLEYEAIFERSAAGKAQVNPATGRFLKVNQAFADMVGYAPAELCEMTFMDITHPEDRDLNMQRFESVRMGNADSLQIEERCLKKDGAVVWVNVAGNLVRFGNGQPDRMIAVIQDITDRKQAEDAVKASLKEKEVLLKEIHHRVKNNMQIISSLVSLQADQSQDPTIQKVLWDVSHRVRSMAMVHEKLYQSRDLARIDFAQYAESLLTYLWRSYRSTSSKIRLAKDLESILLSVDEAVPLGLILNELISNALKHAFPSHEKGEVLVTFQRTEQNGVFLSVRDSGKGLPKGFNWKTTESLGLRLVRMLTGQLDAEVHVTSDGGTAFKVIFGRTSV